VDVGPRRGAEVLDFLTVLGPAARGDLRERGRLQRYRAEAVVLYEGQVDAPVVVVVDGRVRVTALAGDGRELVLAFRGPGAILGELAALQNGRCSATVTPSATCSPSPSAGPSSSRSWPTGPTPRWRCCA
jgi:hypothetical protein